MQFTLMEPRSRRSNLLEIHKIDFVLFSQAKISNFTVVIVCDAYCRLTSKFTRRARWTLIPRPTLPPARVQRLVMPLCRQVLLVLSRRRSVPAVWHVRPTQNALRQVRIGPAIRRRYKGLEQELR